MGGLESESLLFLVEPRKEEAVLRGSEKRGGLSADLEEVRCKGCMNLVAEKAVAAMIILLSFFLSFFLWMEECLN